MSNCQVCDTRGVEEEGEGGEGQGEGERMKEAGKGEKEGKRCGGREWRGKGKWQGARGKDKGTREVWWERVKGGAQTRICPDQ